MIYGTLLLTGAGLVAQAVGFVYRIFLSRMVGAEIMGLYQLILPVSAVIMSLAAVGPTVAVSQLSGEFCAREMGGGVRAVLRRCGAAFLAIFVPVAAVIVLFSDAISVYILRDARTRLGLLLLMPCILLTGIENLHKHFFYGTGNVRPPALVELCEQFIRAGAVLGLLAAFLPQNPERTVGLIVLGMVLCEVFSAVTLVTLCRRYMAGLPRVPAKAGLNRRIASIAVPAGVTALLGNLMGSANAILIPQRLVAAGADVSQAMSAFGVLCGMTAPMLNMPSAFIGAMGLVLVPRLAQSAALGRLDRIRDRINKAMLATSVLIMPCMAFLVVLGPAIGRFLFREPTAGQFILPLSAGVLLSCYQSVLGGVLNGVGKHRRAAWNAIVCAAVQLGCTWFFMGLPGVGLGGYVAGFVISSALGLLLNWPAVGRYAGMRPRIFQWCTAPMLASVLTGLCINLLFRVLTDSGVGAGLAGLACLVFGGVEYLAALAAQGVPVRALFRLN
ncbi:stage V sporulation protein B [Pseudoflavonifractor sp. 524-17]|uniref:oligosaccharide flippase family protein n=1 Tax=Pseudoflavonifractor sp. 524-17 TaxID=2304577 RepID=UPI00137A206F|nr:polysaccharide biosynthesis C-terminal domain-containing protein [Pseudoflavonifractor sp. 524-17]NCE65232.1 stage V sporulation protein B [Pseudoflavonifractor sp. 524-17]